MAIQTINIGQNVNDGTGDDLRTAFDKVNDNFTYLDGLGGETNTASNLAGLGEGIFAGKSGVDLQFKRIRSANSATLTVTSDGTSIILNNLSPDEAAFRRVQSDNPSDTITAVDKNGIFAIKGGVGITTSISGTNVVIDSTPDIIFDTTPQLGGTLDLNGNNITSGANLTITSTGNITANNFVGYLTGDVKGSVFGDDSTPIVDAVNNTLNGNLTGNVTGNLTGNVTGSLLGSLGSDLDLNTYGIISTTSGSALSPSAARLNLALGFDLGGGYPSLNSPATLTPDSAYLIRMNDNDEATWEYQGTINDEQMVPTSYLHYLTSGSITDGYGQIIGHSYKEAAGERTTMGFYGYQVLNGKHTFVAIPVKPNGDLITGLQVDEDGAVTLDSIQIKDEEITTTRSNEDLKLNTNGTGTIDFYGLYRFPQSLGQAGEVLKVPTSGNLLEWGTGGGGSSTTAISGITGATPGVVTTTVAHGLSDGQAVTITDVVGMTALNGNEYYADVLSSTTFALYSDDALTTPVSTAAYPPYVSGGFVTGEAGAGSASFVGLNDTPNSYAGAAGDADKLVQVNGTGNGLVFTDYNTIIDATYIEGKGFLPKGGGTMSGNINLGTNDISNGGTITATTFSGALSGNVTGNVTAGNIRVGVTGTNEIDTSSGDLTLDSAGGTVTVDDDLSVTGTLFVSTIDSSDSSAITVTPGVTMNSFLTVESSLNVLDTVTTKDLNSTGNATFNNVVVSGTLTADNFNISGSGTPTFSSGSDIVFTAVGQLTTNVPLLPNADGTINLGSASYKWQNIYSDEFTGDLTGNVTGNVSGNVVGNVTAGNVRVGVTATGEIDTSSGNLTLDSTGGTVTVDDELAVTGNIDATGNVTVGDRLFLEDTDDLTITATASPSTIPTSSSATFVTTNNYVGVGADLAYANLGSGTSEGQIKIIKMVNRGEYSTDSVTFFDRYLQINLTINGAAGTLNVSENSEFGSTILIWHGSSWYEIGKVDS